MRVAQKGLRRGSLLRQLAYDFPCSATSRSQCYLHSVSLSPDPERPDRTSKTSHIIIRVGGVVCCLVRPSLFVVVAFPLFHVFFSARQLEAVGCAEKKGNSTASSVRWFAGRLAVCFPPVPMGIANNTRPSRGHAAGALARNMYKRRSTYQCGVHLSIKIIASWCSSNAVPSINSLVCLSTLECASALFRVRDPGGDFNRSRVPKSGCLSACECRSK